MDSVARLIEAIAKLIAALASFAWPIAVVVGVWLVLRKQGDAVRGMFSRVRKLSVAGIGEAELAEQVEERRENIEQTAEELRHLISSSEEIAAQLKKSLSEAQAPTGSDNAARLVAIQKVLKDLEATTRRREEEANQLIDGLIGDADQLSVLVKLAHDSTGERVMTALRNLASMEINPGDRLLAGADGNELRRAATIREELRTVLADQALCALILAEVQEASPKLHRMLRIVRNGGAHGDRRFREIISAPNLRNELQRAIREIDRKLGTGPKSEPPPASGPDA